MRILVSLVLMGLASFASAHSMSPGYQKEMAIGNSHTMVYNIANDFDFPVTLRIDIFERDGVTPAEDWKVDRRLFKMVPGNNKNFSVTFKTDQERKVIVCSVLDKVGYDEEEPTTITRVCSRLWLYK